MDVDASEARRFEDVLRQDSPISHDERDVDVLIAEPRRKLSRLELRRLHHVQPELERPLFYRRWGELEAAALRLVRLTDDAHDLRDLDERVEARHGELRRPEEDGAEALRR